MNDDKEDFSLWPIVLIQGRYRGWGTWWAYADLEKNAPDFDIFNDGPHDGDWAAHDFYKNPPAWAAYGETPDGATDALVQKQKREC